jgi:hypothetical protein
MAANANLYRDADLGIRARLVELDARIRDREALVTDAFWDSLSAEVRERLETLRVREEDVTHEGASLEDLARAENLLSSYLDELDHLIAGLPALEEEWREVPKDVPDPPAVATPLIRAAPSEEEWNAFVRSFTAIVRERDAEAVITRDTSLSLLARFHDRGAPFSLRATAYTAGSSTIAEVAMCLFTSIARGLPPLTVQHESLALSFGKMFGIKHEVEVGDPSFDGLFLIEASKPAAELLLTPNVRGHLLTLSRFDVPLLEVIPSRRLAALQWYFEPAAKALDAAVRVLATIRETPPQICFRR